MSKDETEFDEGQRSHSDQAREPAERAGEGADIATQLAELRRERDEYKDKYLRAQAECVNVARRLSQQFAEERRLASMNFAREMLPVLDNFDRTLASFSGTKPNDPILVGIRLISDQLTKALSDQGIEPIETVGKPFDPQRHQAIVRDHESNVAPGTITKELERGYMISDRVLRPAKVMVAASHEVDEHRAVRSGADGAYAEES